MTTINMNNDNFVLLAMKAYDKLNPTMTEFEEDLKHIKYVKRLIRKYKKTGELRERLILNHIIILSNCFGVREAVRMLFFKLNTSDYPILKTFLLYLNYMPELIDGINTKTINSHDITVDLNVGQKIRSIEQNPNRTNDT